MLVVVVVQGIALTALGALAVVLLVLATVQMLPMLPQTLVLVRVVKTTAQYLLVRVTVAQVLPQLNIPILTLR
jgi:hypothetical protein